MMYILTGVCFDRDSLKGADIAWVIGRGLGFTPSQIRTNEFSKSGASFDLECDIERVALSSRTSEVRLQTEKGPSGPYFQVVTLAAWSMQVVYWRVEGLDEPSSDLVNELTERRGFNAAYRCAAEDVFWQSETNVATYELFGRDHRSLAKARDPEADEQIDISRNPGRRSPFRGMWLQSAWQMWFGAGAFRHLDRGRLLSFQPAERVEALDSGAVFIQLSKDPFDFDSQEHRARQKAFREWCGLDQLETRAMDLVGESSDSSTEIAEGRFLHGGVRRLTQWLDARNNLVRRSLAVKRIEIELDSRGNELWREEHPVSRHQG